MVKRWMLQITWILLFTGCTATQTVLKEHLQSRFPKGEHLEKANGYKEKREYEKAEKEYSTLLSLYPGDYEVLKEQADLYYCMHEWQQAADAYGLLLKMKREKENVLRYYSSMKEMVKDWLRSSRTARPGMRS